MSDPEEYTVGWICAISTEYIAAQELLDEEHDPPEQVNAHDSNDYTLGAIGKHKVVIAVLPEGEYGTASAASVATNMLASFPNVRIGLMVGIGGGAPSNKHDIRLGDIVVSAPRNGDSGIFQYDFGKTIQNEAFQNTRLLNQPPTALRTAITGLQAQHKRKGHRIHQVVESVLERNPRLQEDFQRPSTDTDRLFRPEFVHDSRGCAEFCATNPSNLVLRRERGKYEDNPAIYYGTIASANQLMKDATIRDALVAEKNVLCFEMEAGGLMNTFPCLVIRGICDYSDSHKNKEWQGYAAMVAAAYAKELLCRIPPNKVEVERRITEIVKDELKGIRNTVEETGEAVEAIREDNHTSSIKNWLSPSDASTNANHAKKLRQSGTGEWILDTDAFKEWEAGSRRHLWLYGKPGCGKTVLTSMILDHLRGLDDDEHVTLDFFFDFRDTQKQSLDDMLRSLLFQLYINFATRDIELRKALTQLFTYNGNGMNQPTTSQLWETLHKMMQFGGKVCIVLDALDECATWKELIEWIKNTTAHPSLSAVQLILVSRPEDELQHGIQASIGKENCILLDKDSISPDISRYIQVRLEQSDGFKRWAVFPEVLKQIKDEIGGKSDGMFRWAACQLDSLESCLDRESLEEALRSLPRDLYETYDRILQNIPLGRKKKAIRLMQFLVHAERPLTLEEAVDVIAIRLETHNYFDARDRLPFPEEIKRFCPSLVSVVRASDSEKEELHFAHFSVKEYLQQSNIEGFCRAEDHMTITSACLAYLTSHAKEQPLDVPNQFPLSRYAAKVWTVHARKAETSDRVVDSVVNFLQKDEMLHLWNSLLREPKESNEESPVSEDSPREDSEPEDLATEDPAPEDPASEDPASEDPASEDPASEDPASEDPEPEQQASDTATPDDPTKGGSSLYFSCSEGLTVATRRLLLTTEDVNIAGGYLGNPLQAASAGGYREIVYMLLDKGTNINAQGGYYGTAIKGASANGHLEIVQILLKLGAHVACGKGEFGTALEGAAANGHRDVVHELLRSGVDVNVNEDGYANALQAAAAGGHKDVVKMLLDAGAEVNVKDEETPQYEWAPGFPRYFLEMCLDNDSNIAAKNSSALQSASYHGYKEIVRLLLASGANVNDRGGFFGSSIQAAAYRGHLEVVKMLLDEGADAAVTAGTFGSALKIASSKGHNEIVQLLQDNGATFDGEEPGPAKSIIELLMESFQVAEESDEEAGANEANMEEASDDSDSTWVGV